MSEYIVKTTPITPTQGLIVDSMDIESSSNAPSINAVNKALYKPNLLINGDFQCNQRGKSEYLTTEYTVDMWYLYRYDIGTQGKLVVLENGKGIRLINTNFKWVSINQKISDYYRGKTVTLVAKIKSVSGTTAMFIKESSTIGGINIIYGRTNIKETGIIRTIIDIPIDKAYSTLTICVQTAGTVDIEYIDLFEGDIAYPHQKEDSTIALMRCQRYIYAFGKNEMHAQFNTLFRYPLSTYSNTTKHASCYIMLPIKMKSLPTGVIKDVAVGIQQSGIAQGKTTLSVEHEGLVVFKTTDSPTMTSDNENMWGYGSGYVIATCEPLS